MVVIIPRFGIHRHNHIVGNIYIHTLYIPIIAGKYPHGFIPPCVFRQAPSAPANGGALKAMDLRAATHLTQVGMEGIDGHQAKYGNGKSFAKFFF